MWGGGVKVEIKAISAQPTEGGVGLSWAELGNIKTSRSIRKYQEKSIKISRNIRNIKKYPEISGNIKKYQEKNKEHQEI